MKQLQKFLDIIFPHQYVITDSWEEMDSEYDVYGIYLIPLHKRALGLTECLRDLQKYSPEFVIMQYAGQWFFQYTVTNPQTRDEPSDSFYVEFGQIFDRPEHTLVGLVKWIVEDMSKDFFLNEQMLEQNERTLNLKK